MLLYVHVPFCVRKCWYCAFSSGAFSLPAAERYTSLIVRELADWAQILGPRKIATVYFGGGTPSLLAPAQLGAILDRAAQAFDLSAVTEITLEANPESVIRDGFLEGVRALGVNRISLGVQSLHDTCLGVLGRVHDSAGAFWAVQAIQAAGFANLNLDLMWGLPNQTPEEWLEDLSLALTLGPAHVSCYGLTLEPGTALAEDIRRGLLTLPDEESAVRMYDEGRAFLEAHGFAQYEISNYARPGRESQHNQGYWAGLEFLGLGPSAVSTLGDKRLTNAQRLEDYAFSVEQGGVGRGVEILPPQIQSQEMIMLALRTKAGLDLEKFMAVAGEKFPEHHPFIQDLCASRLIRLHSGHLQLTPQGLLVSNSIIEQVLDIVDQGQTKTGNT